MGTFGPIGCKVLSPRPYAAQRPFSAPPGTHRGRWLGAGIATWAGRGRAPVRGIVVVEGIQGDPIELRHSHEWLGEREGSSPYRNAPNIIWRKTLSSDLFLLTTAPSILCKPPCRTLPEPNYARLILRHLPMHEPLLDVQGARSWFWVRVEAARAPAMQC